MEVGYLNKKTHIPIGFERIAISFAPKRTFEKFWFVHFWVQFPNFSNKSRGHFDMTRKIVVFLFIPIHWKTEN